MRKILLIMPVLLFSVISFAQENKCSKYKNGTFKLLDQANNVTYIIERNGNKQYEQIEGEKTKIDFDVNWISDCSYTLHPTKETIELIKADFSLIVEIVEIKEKSLVLKMFAKESPQNVITREVEIIKTL
ncbi:MAG: hypothetical protein ABI426_00350 [Flavobacterium sp.]